MYTQRSAAKYVQPSATIAMRRSSAHFIAMAEMVVHSAQLLKLLQRYLVLSISNETKDQLHPSQVKMNNAVEQIHKEMFASVLISHRPRIVQMRAAI